MLRVSVKVIDHDGASPSSYRQVGSKHENGHRSSVKVTVTKPVSFKVQRLHEILGPRNVTQ